MTCYRPISAYIVIGEKTENGKDKIVFEKRLAGRKRVQPIDLPCGKCTGCKIRRSKEWAVRCVHEAQLWSRNCFVTLTYNEENFPENGSLKPEDFTNFMKRFRKECKGYEYYEDKKGNKRYPIRYFQCGEYGDNFSRPHHHACIFNYDFPDKKLWQVKNGVRLYVSEKLEKLWKKGYCLIGDVNYMSAAYIAQYVIKKKYGDRKEDHYKKVDINTGEIIKLHEEYITMSRRPGIAKLWFERFGDEVFNKDFVALQGRVIQTPRFYDKIYDKVNPEDMEKIKRKRKERSKKTKKHSSGIRLRVREEVSKGKLKLKKRRYET